MKKVIFNVFLVVQQFRDVATVNMLLSPKIIETSNFWQIHILNFFLSCYSIEIVVFVLNLDMWPLAYDPFIMNLFEMVEK